MVGFLLGTHPRGLPNQGTLIRHPTESGCCNESIGLTATLLQVCPQLRLGSALCSHGRFTHGRFLVKQPLLHFPVQRRPNTFAGRSPRILPSHFQGRLPGSCAGAVGVPKSEQAACPKLRLCGEMISKERLCRKVSGLLATPLSPKIGGAENNLPGGLPLPVGLPLPSLPSKNEMAPFNHALLLHCQSYHVGPPQTESKGAGLEVLAVLSGQPKWLQLPKIGFLLATPFQDHSKQDAEPHKKKETPTCPLLSNNQSSGQIGISHHAHLFTTMRSAGHKTQTPSGCRRTWAINAPNMNSKCNRNFAQSVSPSLGINSVALQHRRNSLQNETGQGNPWHLLRKLCIVTAEVRSDPGLPRALGGIALVLPHQPQRVELSADLAIGMKHGVEALARLPPELKPWDLLGKPTNQERVRPEGPTQRPQDQRQRLGGGPCIF